MAKNFRLKTKWTTEFFIFELAQVPNFQLKLTFARFYCCYFIKLFHMGFDRHNGILMSFFLLFGETIIKFWTLILGGFKSFSNEWVNVLSLFNHSTKLSSYALIIMKSFMCNLRSCRREVFFQKGALKNFIKSPVMKIFLYQLCKFRFVNLI